MTATVMTQPTDAHAATAGSRPSLWKAGLQASAIAAVATTAVAVAAKAADVPLEAGGEAIPVLAFGQLTLLFSVVGLALASVLRRRADRPRATWLAVALVLTALSLIPDLLLDADVATRCTLMVTHIVAAATVIPAVARHLPERATR